MAFAHYGPFWLQMRKLCVMKLFSRRRAETWVAVRDECAALVRGVASSSGGGQKAVNLGELIFNLTKNVTFRAAFGTRDGEDQEEFIAILQEFSKLFGAFNIGDFLPWLGWMDLQGINRRLRAARSALDRFIDKIIDEHVRRGKSPDDADADMVDDMLAFFAEAKPAAVNGGKGGAAANGDDLQSTLRLTRDNIKAIIMVRIHVIPLTSWLLLSRQFSPRPSDQNRPLLNSSFLRLLIKINHMKIEMCMTMNSANMHACAGDRIRYVYIENPEIQI